MEAVRQMTKELAEMIDESVQRLIAHPESIKNGGDDVSVEKQNAK